MFPNVMEQPVVAMMSYVLTMVALAAGSLPLCFLLASSTCHPSPGWAYIYGYFLPSQPLHPEDGGSMDLRNIGILPLYHMALQPRRPHCHEHLKTRISLSTLISNTCNL